MKNKLLFITNVFFIFCISFSQNNSDQIIVPVNTGARYLSGDDGTIRMYVNVWGHVGKPGRILVDEGIDFATLLSLTGGPNKGANLKNISIYHEYPNTDGKISHVVDLSEFIKTGDRSNFIPIQPNDTFIIEQTTWSYIIGEMGTVNTLMNLINIYLNIYNLFSNSD